METPLNRRAGNIPASNDNQYGMSTQIALKRLHDEIERLLQEHERQFLDERYYRKICLAFIERYESPLGWMSIITSLLIVITLLFGKFYLPALALLFILVMDLIVVVRECNLRRTEVYRKTRRALHDIQLAAQSHCKLWQSCNYPHLYTPLSPCISMQWTYRDGRIVNLPWSLLVEGDCIVLRPGQISPGPCLEIDGQRRFRAGETYGVACDSQTLLKPVVRTPLPNLLCYLETTPFLANFSKILESNHKRPATIYNQQRFLLVTKYIQQWGFTLSICITIIALTLQMYGICLFPLEHKDPWFYIFVESCTAAAIPLLPLVFPLMWISINLWGIARLDCFLQSPNLFYANDLEKHLEEDLDTSIFNYENTSLHRSRVFCKWLHLWLGDSKLLGRSANVVQVLGSITALCCIDKKGILSWPNPTAEKVFFLRENLKLTDDEDNTDYTSSIQLENELNDMQQRNAVIPEVLDLTHDQYCPFRLEFDDHGWSNHIKSLKPLGLAILLNTCSTYIHPLYTEFCGHINAVATLNKNLVPINNRRCLCDLAKRIGFTDHATNCFDLEGLLATYSQMNSNNILRPDSSIGRKLQMSTRIPFPHSLSAVMRDNHGGYLSLFTQGTADIVLDCCDDFWDGKDLRPLTEQDRKRALDFYQRSALTAYCTAFAYRPLRHCLKPPKINIDGGTGNVIYLEFPASFKMPMQAADVMPCDLECSHSKLSHSLSTDSLSLPSENDNDVNNMDKCLDMQCHQVFIGMVTMQYQAQTDIVQLVERLERACIRFVHFSKENELRSRVFSEKMGLESGWNCHISLLSQSNNNVSLRSSKQQNSTLLSNRNIDSPAVSGHVLKTTKIKSTPNAVSSSSSSNINEINQVNTLTTVSTKSAINLDTSKALSSSAPCTISNQNQNDKLNRDKKDYSSTINLTKSQSSLNFKETLNQHQSLTSSMAHTKNCHSASILTDSTEPSAAVNFDMSNRAKLPIGIENIRPHLEKVDNVPLQVSLFTDCSPEATRQMLEIMQSYGEIVVCLGSSASNSNVQIFLQADCSIAVEPLYPQVCQNIEAFKEDNLLHNPINYSKLKSGNGSIDLTNDSLAPNCRNKFFYKYTNRMWPTDSATGAISPIYLSRILNSLPCSISVKREDSLSIVAIIELSRRFSSGLWNCIQFWACCAATLSIINVLCCCLSLPTLLTPIAVIYLMCIPIPLLSLALAHMDLDLKIMHRATGKKQTKYDTGVFGFVLWCYGCKFMTPTLMMILYYYALVTYHIKNDNDTWNAIHFARTFSLLGVSIHFVIISSTFVHRDYLLWRKNPFRNRIWSLTSLCILLTHTLYTSMQIVLHENILNTLREYWPLVGLLCSSSILSLTISEICKWQEIKINLRHQRRARLDFGTKLGMNSPF